MLVPEWGNDKRDKPWFLDCLEEEPWTDYFKLWDWPMKSRYKEISRFCLRWDIESPLRYYNFKPRIICPGLVHHKQDIHVRLSCSKTDKRSARKGRQRGRSRSPRNVGMARPLEIDIGSPDREQWSCARAGFPPFRYREGAPSGRFLSST